MISRKLEAKLQIRRKYLQDTSDKTLYTQNTQRTLKAQQDNNPIKNWAKDLNILPKKIYKNMLHIMFSGK